MPSSTVSGTLIPERSEIRWRNWNAVSRLKNLRPRGLRHRSSGEAALKRQSTASRIPFEMPYDIPRIRALAKGSVEPATGMEAHFVRVVRGEALPASPEEVDWLKISTANINIGGRNITDSPHTADLIVENRLLTEQLNQATQQVYELRETQYESDYAKQAFQEAIVQLKADLAKSKAELAKVNSELTDSLRKVQSFTSDLSHQVEVRLDSRSREIVLQIEVVKEKNSRLAKLIVEQNAELRKGSTPRVKCPVCEGQGTYYDISTYESGAGWEGPKARDVCEKCHGAGYIKNPVRELVEAAESEIADIESREENS